VPGELQVPSNLPKFEASEINFEVTFEIRYDDCKLTPQVEEPWRGKVADFVHLVPSSRYEALRSLAGSLDPGPRLQWSSSRCSIRARFGWSTFSVALIGCRGRASKLNGYPARRPAVLVK
jgi:hypothetical protein